MHIARVDDLADLIAYFIHGEITSRLPSTLVQPRAFDFHGSGKFFKILIDFDSGIGRSILHDFGTGVSRLCELGRHV